MPTNRVCVICQRLLPEVRPTPAPEPHSAFRDAHATRRDAPGAVLRIRLDTEEFVVTPGNTLLLGRDASAYRTGNLLERHDNVSRRHATVGMETDGTAWVRDEHSTNGTFVNATPLRPGVRAPLRDGDTLRLAADCTLDVVLGGGAVRADGSGR
ncbi:FHA domain-containing protein [Streptomyces sp. NPDC088246]|uniref:FHA domain-containing protein n=1 Tax=Streptomyces sp. NPDC088246 TaxID=3365842 RepID=UPI003829F0E0